MASLKGLNLDDNLNMKKVYLHIYSDSNILSCSLALRQTHCAHLLQEARCIVDSDNHPWNLEKPQMAEGG